MVTPVWILLLLARLSVAIKIYLQPALTTAPPSPLHVSPPQARILLSHQLRLDSFDSLDDTVGDSLEQILREIPFVGQGTRNAMLLTVDESIAKDVLPSSLQPAFALSNPDHVSYELSQVVYSFLLRAEHTYSTIISSTTDSPHFAAPRFLDIFTASPSSGTEMFLAETASLVSFIESPEDDVFGAFELKGLAEIAADYGRNSEQYELASETTRALLASAVTNPKITLAILSYPSDIDKRQVQPPPQSPLPPPTPPPQQPIGGVSTCHSSADICSNATNACSGRGACSEASKAGRTCFICACNVTLDDKGRRQWWVGDACERKDISGPFVLITGTVITLILLIGGSISLLYGVGGHQLPSTLTGGAIGGHLKHD